LKRAAPAAPTAENPVPVTVSVVVKLTFEKTVSIEETSLKNSKKLISAFLKGLIVKQT
jgi:hypothetical protein